MNASSKIKILRIVTQAEVVAWHLKNFIDRSENEFNLYIAGDNVSRYSKEYPHVTFIDIHIVRKISPLKDLVALVRIIFLLLRLRPQILHSIMPKAGFLASIAGSLTFTPIRIHTFTGQVWATKQGFSRRILKLMDKIIFRLNTACLTDSPSQSDFLYRNGFMKGGNPISYLGKGSLSGVSLQRFQPLTIDEKVKFRKTLGIEENDFVFVYLARKSIVKGIIELFSSFSEISHIPHIKLLFIGPDESNGELKKLREQYMSFSNKIIELDIVKDHEKYLGISDVLCLPSSSEGFGTIVIEAAAVNVPSIGFDITGLRDAIEHDFTGLLVPFKDVKQFSQSMISLYKDSDKLNFLKESGRKRILEFFSADAVYKYQHLFYLDLIKQKK